MRLAVRRGLILPAVVALVVVSLAGCGSTDPGSEAARPAVEAATEAANAASDSGTDSALDAATSTPSEKPDVEPVDFCEGANAFITSTSARLLTTPDAAVFASIDLRLAALVDAAPGDLVDDLGSLRSGFGTIDAAYAATGYDPNATVTLSSDVLSSNAVAAERLERYLIASCDLDGVRAEQIDAISRAFGIDDVETAECVHAQLGNVANIDASDLTPELMTTPVCGTSVFGLLSGAQAE